jgi:hypothetical protein
MRIAECKENWPVMSQSAFRKRHFAIFLHPAL